MMLGVILRSKKGFFKKSLHNLHRRKEESQTRERLFELHFLL